MQDTAVPSFFAELSAQERAHLFTDAHLRTLLAAFASIPDPRQCRGQRYDLPLRTNFIHVSHGVHARGIPYY